MRKDDHHQRVHGGTPTRDAELVAAETSAPVQKLYQDYSEEAERLGEVARRGENTRA